MQTRLGKVGRLEVDNTYMQRCLDVYAGCRIEVIKVLRVGNRSNPELF